MTGHDRLLDEIAELKRRLTALEERNTASLQRIADLREHIIRKDALVASLQRQLLDRWTR